MSQSSNDQGTEGKTNTGSNELGQVAENVTTDTDTVGNTSSDTMKDADKDDGYQSQPDVADVLEDSVPDISDSQDATDNADELDLGDTSSLDSDDRNKLFQRGLSFDKQRKRNCALKCYLACVKGLQRESKFALLPQCLRNIADIYYHKEEFDKAVQFIQAEKVYYESALIDTEDIQHRLEEAQNISEDSSFLANQNTDTVRADEYEHLARLCLDRDQPLLALEYAGKATKLRQQLLGDGHLVTQQSLDFFASVYAKLGAEQYQDSLKKFSIPKTESNNNLKNGEGTEPVSILRKRKPETEKKVRFDDTVSVTEQNSHQEELISKTVLWFLLTVCCILLFLLGLYLFCRVNAKLGTCQNLYTQLYYFYMKLKYYYYHYTSSSSGPKYT